MRIKRDENLPVRLVPELAALGHDVDTVPAERLGGRDDHAIWRAAQQDSRFLITQDLDFSDARRYTPGTHAGLLIVRLANPGREALAIRIVSLFRQESVEKWRGCLVIATDRKVRVKHPTSGETP